MCYGKSGKNLKVTKNTFIEVDAQSWKQPDSILGSHFKPSCSIEQDASHLCYS